MEKSSVGYRGFSSTGPSPVDHKACGNVLSLSRLRTASDWRVVTASTTRITKVPSSPTSDGTRLRTWTEALPTKCTPRTMPQGDPPPRYVYSRTCRCLTTGSDLSSAWNTSSDELPLDPPASDCRSFFLQRIQNVMHHPPSLPRQPTFHQSMRAAPSRVRPPGDSRGEGGMGAGRAYELMVTQGRPKQGQDRYSHLSEVAYSHLPIKDNANRHG
mmetsp:Transcript_17193/g.39971  ORF Transcript_17193/g.39971 Transcript_17193/m.39971 type:complete len:214 (-) Transcript_17193:298-939(-)